MNKEGFYSIQFRGAHGNSVGILVLDTNVVTGADPYGAIYDGTYHFNVATGNLDVTATITIPPGLIAVTGVAAGNAPVKFDLSVSIPRGTLTGSKHIAKMPDGRPVEFILNKIRSFP